AAAADRTQRPAPARDAGAAAGAVEDPVRAARPLAAGAGGAALALGRPDRDPGPGPAVEEGAGDLPAPQPGRGPADRGGGGRSAVRRPVLSGAAAAGPRHALDRTLRRRSRKPGRTAVQPARRDRPGRARAGPDSGGGAPG